MDGGGLVGRDRATGNGTVTYTVAPNTGVPRTGTLLIAGRTLTVTQGSGCTYAIDPVSVEIGNLGGIRSVQVTAGPECSWTAASGAPWITILSGASGTGNGTVGFLVGVNLTGQRSGTITIGGRTFTVIQGN